MVERSKGCIYETGLRNVIPLFPYVMVNELIILIQPST